MTVDSLLAEMAFFQNLRPAAVTDGSDVEARYFRALNHALRRLCNHAAWKWLQTEASVNTTGAQDYIQLPADFETWQTDRGPYIAGQTLLEYVSGEQLDIVRGLSAAPGGRPRWYHHAYDGANRRWRMTLYPVPDGVYAITVPYRRRIARLTTRTETPQIPDELHELLAIGAMAEIESKLERNAEGSKEAEFQAGLARAWATHGSPVTTQPGLRLRPPPGEGASPFEGRPDYVYVTPPP